MGILILAYISQTDRRRREKDTEIDSETETESARAHKMTHFYKSLLKWERIVGTVPLVRVPNGKHHCGALPSD